MSLHDDPAFECEICEHLPAHGWLHEDGSASALSRELAPYAPDLLAWMQQAQPRDRGGAAEQPGLQGGSHPAADQVRAGGTARLALPDAGLTGA